jgi:hypothetical protein
MAGNNPESRSGSGGKRSRKPAALVEVLHLLDRIHKDHPAARLDADLARDAVLDLYRKLGSQLQRAVAKLRSAQKKRDQLHDRLVEVLHDLATGPMPLPPVPGRAAVPHEQLAEQFRQLKTKDFPALAGRLQTAVGRSGVPAYQRFLVEEILLKGSRILAEHLLRHAGTDASRTAEGEAQFLAQLRHHVAGNVARGLARKVAFQVSPEFGADIDTLIGRSLGTLLDLMTATPAGRLLLPADQAAFDPSVHEPSPGRPAVGKVRATLFPGYLVLESPPRVVEKALVFTEADRASSFTLPAYKDRK